MENEIKVMSTELGEIQKNTSAGTMYLICGVCTLIFGIFTIGIFIGIFGILGAVALFNLAKNNFQGYRLGECPYCHNSVQVEISDTTKKCPHCSKVSSVRNNKLNRID